MSYKKLLIVLLLGIIFLVPKPAVKAQDELPYDYDRAYQDYVFAKDVYEKKNSDYLLARAQYLQANTLVSQTQARTATEDMLQARDDVVILYVNALKFKLNETEGVTQVVKDGLVTRLEAEQSWFQQHKDGVTSAGSLASLEKDSQEAYNRFSKNTSAVAYETLSTVAIAKVSVLRNSFNTISSDLRKKTFEIKAKGDFDISEADRWFLEVDNKVQRSLDQSISAESSKANFVLDEDRKREPRYNNITASMQESQQLLVEAGNYIRETIRTIVSPN